jgi:flagella basal body P-ring formation protein FlgA
MLPSPLASRLMALPLGREAIEADHGWVEIDQVELRRVLTQHGVDPSMYVLRGQRTEVRAMPLAGPERASVSEISTASVEAPSVTAPPADTLRARIEQRVRTLYDVKAQDLRLGFRDRDRELLDQLIDGRTVHIEPVGTSREIPLSITIYAGDQIDLHTTIRTQVSIQRDVLRLNSSVRRGERLREELWTSERAWVPASEQHADIVSVRDAVATAALNAGEVILARHIEAPIVVRRGDLVTVHCVSGSVIVKTEARATRDARTGERIEFIAGTSRRAASDASRFQARVLGPGVAVSRVEEQSGVAGASSAADTSEAENQP